MNYTNTHAHLFRNKAVRHFNELGTGDCFTLKGDSKFYIKINVPYLVVNAVRLETGEITEFLGSTECVVAKDVRIDAKF